MPEQYLLQYLDAREKIEPVWQMIAADNLVKQLFYDESVTCLNDFMKLMQRPGWLPFAVYDEGKPAAFTWLNCINGKSARAHFVIFKSHWGYKKRIGLSRFTYRSILTLHDENGFLFDCLYGITPVTYKLACKAALAGGWVFCGLVPDVCFLAGENRRVDGVVTCATRAILGIEDKI